ncbi:TPA: stable inheritance protein KleA [Pseudomonas aeruginosa]|nr:stable inheritance protein KleA [Pseudomonas aeruginosa]
MPNTNPKEFMAWIDKLPEIGDPIRRERSRLLEIAEQAAELDRHAKALRDQLRQGQLTLLNRVMQHYSLGEIEAAERQSSQDDATAALLRSMQDGQMRTALQGMDGHQPAIEALIAFRNGAVLRHPDLLNSASDEERRNTIKRLIDWWNVAARPAFSRVEK